jgi:hypothetical protein
MREALIIIYLIPPAIFYIYKAIRESIGKPTNIKMDVGFDETNDLDMEINANFMMFVPIYNYRVLYFVIKKIITGKDQEF